MTAHCFEYEESAPPAALTDVVLSFWSFRTTEHCPPAMQHTIWPDGCASIGVTSMPHVPAFALCIQPRADSRVMMVPRGARYWGIRFWPDTASAVLGIPAAAIADGPVPPTMATRAASLVTAFADFPEDQDCWSVLERWSLEHIPHSVEGDPVVRAALRHIVLSNGSARVAEVAAASGIGIRQLQRRFVDVTGLTIKAYSRVRRLREALARQFLTDEPISKTAAEGGYADHAHLAREFAELTGMGPTNVLRHLARIDHRNVVP